MKFVVEIDDEATAHALRAHAPRAPCEIVVAPRGAPRTKPRALNIAMPLAKGSLVAVFDAEDVPEPGQLRRAAALFASLPTEVACLQASLVIDNAPQNWMTTLFAMDYAALFDVYNRGLAALDLPLFLGGTSNHFRIEPLREIGFWDAWNVTEDADLGLRLVRAGYAVRTFESETWEEAPGDFAALARQRTRWFKGWMRLGIKSKKSKLYNSLYAIRHWYNGSVATLSQQIIFYIWTVLGERSLLESQILNSCLESRNLSSKSLFRPVNLGPSHIPSGAHPMFT